MNHNAGDPDDGGRPRKRCKRDQAAKEAKNISSSEYLRSTEQELVKKHSHSFGNISVHDTSRAHLGDVHITNHYYPETRVQPGTYEALLKSLAFGYMDARIRNVAPALPETCNWLPQHPYFIAWTDSGRIREHHGFLWIKGKPGSGKSTVMKELLSWAEGSWSEHIILSFFFNGRSPHPLEKSSLGLYRSLLHQLLSRLPDGHTPFVMSFASKVQRRETIGVEEWTETELQNFLIQLVKTVRLPSTAIFIDALDEGAEDDVRCMVEFLNCLTQHAIPFANPLRICLSSRHYPHITVERSLSVTLEDEAEHNRDIELYIYNRLPGNQNPDMKDLQQKIRDKSAGVFLWVVLVVQVLDKAYHKGKNITTMLQKLNEIPPDLNIFFDQIILKDSEDLNECIILLQWVFFAKRPLAPIELYYAVQYTYTQVGGSGLHVVTLDEATRYLRNCSRGLVELTKTPKPTVQFIHESVRDYLSCGDILGQRAPETFSSAILPPNFIADICHEKLAEFCLNYLLQSHHNGSIKKIRRDYPFMSYAANYWWKHLRSSPSPCGTRVLELALELLANKWLTEDDGPASPLYYAAYIGRQELVASMIAFGIDVNKQRSGPSPALFMASHYGYEDIVQILLDSGADVNAGYMFRRPLYLASSNDHEKVVKMLLDSGADVNHGESQGYRALNIASARGHQRVVKMLLNSGADAKSCSALSEASWPGHEKIVQMLLAAGADVNAKGAGNGTALISASLRGRKRVVRMLLDAGANVGARAELGPLVGILLEVKDEEQPFELTALIAASRQGHKEVVQMLLDAGADVNAEGAGYNNAIDAAQKNGHEQVVQVLLNHQAKLK